MCKKIRSTYSLLLFAGLLMLSVPRADAGTPTTTCPNGATLTGDTKNFAIYDITSGISPSDPNAPSVGGGLVGSCATIALQVSLGYNSSTPNNRTISGFSDGTINIFREFDNVLPDFASYSTNVT